MNPGAPETLEADDAALAARVASGDTAAFERLMRLHNRRLYRLARATLGNEADAEEALQDAYLNAFRAIGRFRGESSLATWLSRVVLHECLERLRRQGRRSSIVQLVSSDADERVEHEFMSQPSPGATPHNHAERSEIRALLEGYAASLAAQRMSKPERKKLLELEQMRAIERPLPASVGPWNRRGRRKAWRNLDMDLVLADLGYDDSVPRNRPLPHSGVRLPEAQGKLRGGAAGSTTTSDKLAPAGGAH